MNIPDVLLGLGQRLASVSIARGAARPIRPGPVDFEAVLDARPRSTAPCRSVTVDERSADAARQSARVRRGDSDASSPVGETERPTQDTPFPNESIEEAPTEDLAPQAVGAAQTPVQTRPTAGPSETATAQPSDDTAVVLPAAALLDHVAVKTALSSSTALSAGEAASSAAQTLQGEVAGQALNTEQGAPGAALLLPQHTTGGAVLPGTEEPVSLLTPWSGELKAVSFPNGTESSAASGASGPVEEMEAAALVRGAWTTALSEGSAAAAIEDAGASQPAANLARVATALPQEVADTVGPVQAPPPATESDVGVRGAAKVEVPAPSAERVNLEVVRDFALRSVRYLVTRGERTLSVRLVPESLGELHLEVTSAKEGLFVRLISANPAVREFLGAGLDNLRAALSENGVDVADVLVTTDMASGHPAAGGRSPEWAGPARSPGTADWGRDVSAEGPAAPATTPPHEGALNVLA